MKELRSDLGGSWVSGDGDPLEVVNPSTGDALKPGAELARML